ncbi:MAG: hypothetical protein IPI49_10025 [Myxococcales bacterium]|nr:hypothetical protein [Myxococcales bacterium]
MADPATTRRPPGSGDPFLDAMNGDAVNVRPRDQATDQTADQTATDRDQSRDVSATPRQPEVPTRPLTNREAVTEQLAHGMVARDLTEADIDFLRLNGYEAGPIIRGQREFVMRVFTSTNPDQPTLVSFRGTVPSKVQTLIADLDPTGIGNYQWNPNRDLIEATMRRAAANGKVAVSGHSLGGALAQITASRLPDIVQSVTTFQAPGVSQETAQRLRDYNTANPDQAIESTHHRVLGDAVPRGGETLTDGTLHNYTMTGGNWRSNNLLSRHLASPLSQLERADGNRLPTQSDNPDIGFVYEGQQDTSTDNVPGGPIETARRLLGTGVFGIGGIFHRIRQLFGGGNGATPDAPPPAAPATDADPFVNAMNSMPALPPAASPIDVTMPSSVGAMHPVTDSTSSTTALPADPHTTMAADASTLATTPNTTLDPTPNTTLDPTPNTTLDTTSANTDATDTTLGDPTPAQTQTTSSIKLEDADHLANQIVASADASLLEAAKKVDPNNPQAAIRAAVIKEAFELGRSFASPEQVTRAVMERLARMHDVTEVDWNRPADEVAGTHPERAVFAEALKDLAPPAKIEQLWSLVIQGVQFQKQLNEAGKKHDPNPHYKQLAAELTTMLRARDGGKPALWSGGIDVSIYARAHGYSTLENTKAGELFNQLKLFQDFSTLGPLWNAISRKFVGSFEGDVHVFVRTMDKSSVLFRQELAELVHMDEIQSVQWHVLRGTSLMSMTEIDRAGQPANGFTFDGYRDAATVMEQQSIKGDASVREQMLREQQTVPQLEARLHTFIEQRAAALGLTTAEDRTQLERIASHAELRLKNDPALGVELTDLYAELQDDVAKDLAHLARTKASGGDAN